MSQTSPLEPVVSFDELAAKRMGRVRRYLRTHPRLVTSTLVAVYLLSALPTLLLSVGLSGVQVGVQLACVAGTAVALVYRRRAPMTILSIVFLLECLSILTASGGGGVFGLGMPFVLYTMATAYSAKRSLPLAFLVGSLQMLVLILSGFLGSGVIEVEPDPLWSEAVVNRVIIGVVGGFLVGLYLAAAAIGLYVRNSRIHEAELNHWASQVSRLAQVAERNRIAREMHDVVAHSLSVMIALSEGARVVVKRDPERAGEVLGELSGTGRAALADMRRMLGVLRQDEAGELEPQPTGGSMEQLLEGFRAAGLPLVYTYSGAPLPEDKTFQLTVFRIVQESLTNSLRYARNVTAVQVTVERQRHELHLEITDNGDGTGVPRVGSGRGLRGMRERAALFDGHVQAGPAPERGWMVKAVLNIPETTES